MPLEVLPHYPTFTLSITVMNPSDVTDLTKLQPELAARIPLLQSMLIKTEQQECERAGIVKSWVTTLAILDDATIAHVQRIGCNPPTVEINFYMFAQSMPTTFDHVRQLKDYRAHPSNNVTGWLKEYLSVCSYIKRAISYARKMSFENALDKPDSRLAIVAGKKRARLAAIRDTTGCLPDRYFRVEWTAKVTELLSSDRLQVTVDQIPGETQFDLVRAAMRQLTEQVLQDDSLADLVELIEAQRDAGEPVPTEYVMKAHNGSVHTLVSYDALGGNVQPIPLDEL